ncbi:hypothetical protein OG978_32860 [Streptomyces sp. NBC_01591]|uniref:hypothetical protein n=1 Tax=Streptomyces sp. NBC_01591 TaxID=2975888 RepID=UPI002DD9C61B|nr:hypothetical protein [Streptomyces sp. NBC_01591]WSD71766.1 hypothetical protein OG978_32860 [Streptomyces sp. NBC_01591]
MTATPSAGRIVHYVSHGTPVRGDGSQAFAPACRAAVVTEVDTDDPDRIGLAVLNPTGIFFHPLAAGGSVHADAETSLGGSWHWPERA